MSGSRKFYGVDIGIYPKLFGYPMGVALLLIASSILCVGITFITGALFPIALIVVLWVIGVILNKRYDGNFFYSKKLPQHDYVATRNFILRLNLIKDECSKK